MIELTKLDKSTIYINPHQIECITCNPDTSLTMLSGKTVIVKEAYSQVYEKIIEYRIRIGYFKNEE